MVLALVLLPAITRLFQGEAPPDAVTMLTQTAEVAGKLVVFTLAMLVIGGQRSLSGAVIGTIVIAFVGEGLRIVAGGFTIFGLSAPPLPGLREVGLAIIMLGVLMLRPRGIVGNRELRLPFPR